jgi:hypothetical protein
MDMALYFFVPTAIAAALLANIGIWSPRNGWVKISAIVVTALFLPLAYGSVSELLSRPKPASLEWARRAMPEAQLIGASLHEGKAIYIWLQTPESPEPRAYELPWSKEAAKQLQEAQRQAKNAKNGIKVRRPFETKRDPLQNMFYAAPRKPLPVKRRTREVPLNYVRPDTAG